jgi:phosphoribosyl 1,2-cyclic phosphate phosphodiesterase
MSMKATILGCGSSGGVPRIGGIWGNCDPDNPRNMRRRSSILVEKKGREGITRALVDASPDLRMQLLDIGVGEVDGVIITHEHADHVGGVDDLRQISWNRGQLTDVFMTAHVRDYLLVRNSYCFTQPQSSIYKPILKAREIRPYHPFSISGGGGDISIMPLLQEHGQTTSLGLRFGDFCYANDVSDFPAQTLEGMGGLKILIIDALRRGKKHPTHLTLEQALEWIERIKPERAILTNMLHSLDYDELRASLPPNVEPAFDNLSFEFDDY